MHEVLSTVATTVGAYKTYAQCDVHRLYGLVDIEDIEDLSLLLKER